MTDPTQIEFWITSITGGLHVAATLICLLLGPYIFLRRKGDRHHILTGRAWAGLMVLVNVSALATYELDGAPSLFHIFAVLSLLAVLPGWLYIRKYRASKSIRHLVRHTEFMSWAYYGLFTAGLWQIVISLARIGAIDLPFRNLYFGLGLFTAVAAFAVHSINARRERAILTSVGPISNQSPKSL